MIRVDNRTLLLWRRILIAGRIARTRANFSLCSLCLLLCRRVVTEIEASTKTAQLWHLFKRRPVSKTVEENGNEIPVPRCAWNECTLTSDCGKGGPAHSVNVVYTSQQLFVESEHNWGVRARTEKRGEALVDMGLCAN